MRKLCLLLSLSCAICLLMTTYGATRAFAEPVLTSCYGSESGSVTASGETFYPYGYTAAHPYLPFGTHLLVSYAGASVEVVVNDRGPFVAGRGLDLSMGACDTLGLTHVGVDVVDVEILQ